MNFMPWSDAFLTGIERVDEQHRGLVALVNRAAEVLAHGDERSQSLREVLAELTDYTVTHFRDEIAMMERRGIDPRHLEHHRTAHADFVAQLTGMHRELEAGVLTGQGLLHFLSSWLAMHILDEDQRMARQLEAIDAGTPVSEAYETVEGARAAILQNVNHVLVGSMLTLFQSMTRHNRELGGKNAELARAHAALEAHRDQLESQVAMRTAELARANAELAQARDAAESASRAKTRFLGNLGHDLLTPLNAILGFAHLLDSAGLGEREAGQVARIARAGEHLNGVLSELLLYARIEGAALEPATRAFQPAAIPSQVQERIARAARSRGVQVRLDPDRRGPALLGAEPQLAEAMGVLAANAVRCMDGGTLVLGARTQRSGPQRVRLELRARTEGFSLPPEQQLAIQHAFAQLDATRSSGRGGVGLGFGLAAEIARRLGGTLSVESAGNGATQFSIAVDLPVASAHAVADPGTHAGGYPAARERVEKLLREDDMEVRAAVQALEPELLAGLGEAAMEALLGRVRDYDFAGALDVLRDNPA